LVDDIRSAVRISAKLHKLGINSRHLHVHGSHVATIRSHQLSYATPWQRFDLAYCIERGGLIGIGCGLIAFIILALATDLPLLVHLIVPLIATLFGVWLGGLVGISKENYKISRFHPAIEKGKYLLLVDVTQEQEPRVREALSKGYQNAHLAGTDSTITYPFKISK
jgi:hypothetical protein